MKCLMLLESYPKDLVKLLLQYFDEKRLSSIIASLGRPPKYYSFRVNTMKISPEQLIHDLGLRGIYVKQHSMLEEAMLIKVEGPFDIPVVPKKVVVDKFAAESVMLGAQLYAPGIIRAERVKLGDKVTIVDEFGNPIAYGMAVMSGDDMVRLRRGLAVKIEVSRYKCISLRELPEYLNGLIYEQSIPAMLTSLIVAPRPGEVIVDMCAAPGGKTTHLAQLMGNTGRIYAFDNSRSRIRKLLENIKRLGAKNIVVMLSDSRYIHRDFPALKADRVLIDPPCSALGVRPKIFESKSSLDVISCSNYQLQFFEAAVNVIKPGGVIVYSTCTFTAEENELLVEKVLERYPLELDEQPIRIGAPGLSLIPQNNFLQRFYPDIHDSPGYFIARFVRL